MENQNAVTQKNWPPQGSIESTRGSQYFVPSVDIYETAEELVLSADMPGISSQDVDLRFENGELIVQGRLPNRERKGNQLLTEYEEGDFYRVFQVHESIDSTRIEAECKNGVLTVHLPKEEKVKPRKVAVKSGN
jgi:HSP20 family protein